MLAMRKERRRHELELAVLSGSLQQLAVVENVAASLPPTGPASQLDVPLSHMKADADSKLAVHTQDQPNNANRTSALASAFSSALLLASKIDAATAAAQSHAVYVTASRGTAECAASLHQRFPYMELLDGVADTAKARMAEAAAEAEARRDEASALSALEARLHVRRWRSIPRSLGSPLTARRIADASPVVAHPEADGSRRAFAGRQGARQVPTRPLNLPRRPKLPAHPHPCSRRRAGRSTRRCVRLITGRRRRSGARSFERPLVL
jgi:hypothetical protein